MFNYIYIRIEENDKIVHNWKQSKYFDIVDDGKDIGS